MKWEMVGLLTEELPTLPVSRAAVKNTMGAERETSDMGNTAWQISSKSTSFIYWSG